MSDLISRQDLLKLFENLRDEHETNAISYVALYEVILQQPTIEADNGWHTGNPSEPGKYYVTLAIRHEGTDIRWTELKKYGKNGWDMPDDGAIQVIAWMPAPEVYRGGEDEGEEHE